MQETKITIQNSDHSSIIASFFLGIATALFIAIYWISFKNILIFSFISLATLVIFLTIAILLAKPKKRKIVKLSNNNQSIKPLKPKKVNTAISSIKTVPKVKNAIAPLKNPKRSN